MAKAKQGRETAMPNDVGQWGEKDVSGCYDEPLSIAGEKVDVSALPRFGDESEPGEHKAPLRK